MKKFNKYQEDFYLGGFFLIKNLIFVRIFLFLMTYSFKIMREK